MEILGQQLIAAPRPQVWQALNDPLVLKACLPGCESVEQVSPEEFQVVIKTVIGPLRARFQGSLKIAQALPPESCVMHFEGQGGAVGFGKGTSTVTLKETPEGTELSYAAQAQIGGKLAQVGSRLIDSVAKKMADDFFKAFQQQLSPDATVQAATEVVASSRSGTAPTAAGTDSPSSAAAPRALSPSGQLSWVPAWWLIPAALLGALTAIAGSRWLH